MGKMEKEMISVYSLTGGKPLCRLVYWQLTVCPPKCAAGAQGLSGDESAAVLGCRRSAMIGYETGMVSDRGIETDRRRALSTRGA
jgi:hypothetical protein